MSIILSMVIVKVVGRINLKGGKKRLEVAFTEGGTGRCTALAKRYRTPPSLATLPEALTELLRGHHFVVSRIWKNATDEIQIADTTSVLEEGDHLL